jgi:ubiquinol-cytochrome c reductase iron-sulfur subunit
MFGRVAQPGGGYGQALGSMRNSPDFGRRGAAGRSFWVVGASRVAQPLASDIRASSGRGFDALEPEVELSSATIENPSRRDFLYIATGAVAAVGVAAVVWPLVDQMNPDASTLALASIEVDLSAVPEGQILTVKWRGGPVFVRHRTKKEIDAAQNVNIAELRDPQADKDRVKKPEWLIVSGICTHLGCVPLGHEGDYEGWKCPCHGSVYDTSGRIRQGPAPLNLMVPEYTFLSDTKVKIG